MQSTITGTPFNILHVQLETAADRLIVEAGKTAWLSPSVRMQTTAMQHGGLFGAIKRSLGGGPWFWTELTGPGQVAIAATLPGTIEAIPVTPQHGLLAHRSAFLAGTPGVQVGLGFQQRLGAGLFGGDGFLLQHFQGDGTVWVQLGGSLAQYELAAGQTIWIHPHHVALFDDTMAFTMTTVRGIRNLVFGGEGLFFCVLTGPGRVWCQSLAVPQLAQDLAPYLSAGPHA